MTVEEDKPPQKELVRQDGCPPVGPAAPRRERACESASRARAVSHRRERVENGAARPERRAGRETRGAAPQ